LSPSGTASFSVAAIHEALDVEEIGWPSAAAQQKQG
jgi:hypothetical protein